MRERARSLGGGRIAFLNRDGGGCRVELGFPASAAAHQRRIQPMNAPDLEPQTLLVIDDHPLLRKGVSQLVALEPAMRLVGEATDGAEGLRLARELKPDLILLDLQMRGMGGLDALRAIKALDLDTRVIMFTVSDSEEDVLAALQAGADGYLLKDMEPEEMLASLRQAARGRLVLSAPVTELLAQALLGIPPAAR